MVLEATMGADDINSGAGKQVERSDN